MTWKPKRKDKEPQPVQQTYALPAKYDAFLRVLIDRYKKEIPRPDLDIAKFHRELMINHLDQIMRDEKKQTEKKANEEKSEPGKKRTSKDPTSIYYEGQ